MKSLIAVLMLATIQPAVAWDLGDLFKPQKKKVVQRASHSKSKASKKSEPSPTPRPEERRKNFYTVDIDWMARYRALEAVWSYQIPEDDLIEFEGGKYYVPPVVYRHFDDMATTPKRQDGARTAPQR